MIETFKQARKCLAKIKLAFMLGDGKALADATFDYLQIEEEHKYICALAYLMGV